MLLLDWLKKNKVTQTEFAARAGVTQGTISRLCGAADYWPSRSVAQRVYIATKGEVSADSFLFPGHADPAEALKQAS